MSVPAAPPRGATPPDPNARYGSEQILTKPAEFKNIVLPNDPKTQKPIVIGEGAGQWYAQKVTYADGRTEYEWYERQSGTPGQKDDPVALRTPGPPNPVAAKEFKEAEEEAAKPPAATVRNIGGVPHQLTQDANGQPVWAPAQTTSGPATATGSQAAIPAGSVPRIEGTPRGDGTYDNSAPVRAWHTPDGRIIYEALTPAEVKAEQERQQGPEPKPATTVATSTTEPFIVTRQPNGTLTSTPNPNYKGPEQKPGTAIQVRGGDGKLYIVPVGADGKPGAPIDSGVPPVKPDVKERPRVQDPETKEWIEKGEDGVWRPIKVEGRGPTKPGPNLPQLVLGETQTGLRTFRDQLNAAVAAGDMTPAQATARWNEAKDLAGVVLDEARIVNQEGQSQRAADVNLRTNAMSNATSGFNSALDFVAKLNPYLKEGSTAGGKAFAAILGLQQMHAGRMGAYTNEFSGGGPGGGGARRVAAATAGAAAPVAAPMPPNAIGAGAVPGSITPGATAQDAAAQHAADVMANPAFRPQPPAAYPGPSAPATPPAGPGAGTAARSSTPPAIQGTPSILGDTGAPGAPAAPTVPVPSPYGPVATDANGIPIPRGTVPGAAPTASVGLEGPTDVLTLRTPDNQIVYQMRREWDQTPLAERAQYTVVNAENGPAFLERTGVRSLPSAYGGGSDAPGEVPLSPPASSYGGGGDTPLQMAPRADEFAALSAFRPMTPTPAPVGMPGEADVSPVALMRARIAGAPPWRLGPEDYDWAIQNGLEDQFWSRPQWGVGA